jgi:hypothetical protein
MNQRGVFAKYGFICSFKIQFLCVKHSNFLYPVIMMYCMHALSTVRKRPKEKKGGVHMLTILLYLS